MRGLTSGGLVIISSWMGGLMAGIPPVVAQPQRQEFEQKTLLAQGLSDWTQPYAQALETQLQLPLSRQPLTSVLTRAELAQWLSRFFNYRYDANRKQIITDVAATGPDYQSVQAVVQAGVMRLYEGNQFRPTGNLTKLETLAILVRVLQLPAPTQPDVDRWISLYSDAATVPAVGRPFIAMAGQSGLLVNVPDAKKLNPNVVLRRGDGAVLLHQALVYQQKIRPLAPPIAQLSPPTVASKPEITALRLQPESGVILPGSSLIIEAQATKGGRMNADIDGKVQIPLTEVQPGLYRSTYTVTPNDTFANPALSLQLNTAGGNTRIQRQFPQLVLGQAAVPRAIQPTSVYPAPAPFPGQPAPFNPISTPFPTALQPPPFNPPPVNPNPTGFVPPSSSPPLFTGIRLRPERPLQSGDILTINIWGASGGVAQFDLGSVARNQPMREIRPNLYEGTYVVAPTHRENNPRLAITLTVNGRSDQYQQLLAFGIDGGQSNPLPGTTNNLPQIQNVTASSSNRILRANDILTVTLQGDQGGRATFQILNLTPEIFMQELSPGYYQGQVSIATTTPAINNGTLQFSLERNGQRASRRFPDPITINP